MTVSQFAHALAGLQTSRHDMEEVDHLALVQQAVHGGGAERLRHGGATQLNSEIF